MKPHRLLIVIASALWITAGSVSAQERPWELEIYAGGISGAGAIDGSGQVPPPGPIFTQSFQGVTTTPIPTFPSWYFGAGAAYLNAALARRTLPIAPLDRVLTTASATPQGGGTFGVRVSRRVSRRARIEIAAGHSRDTLAVPLETRDQLEATRASFVTLFNGLSSTSVSFSATSTASVRGSRSVTTVTGAVAVDLLSARRIIPFVLAGAGVPLPAGESPSLSLTGRYVIEFQSAPFPVGIAHSDNVEIRYSVPNYRPVAILGAGLRYAVNRRLIARLDARTYIGRDGLTVSVNANPTSAPTVPTAGASFGIISLSPPSVVLEFSSNPAGSNSLRMPALKDVVTFSGRGMQTRVSLSAGLGWRF